MHDNTAEKQERLDAIQRMLRHAKKIDDDIQSNKVEISLMNSELMFNRACIPDMMKHHKRVAELISNDANLHREQQELTRRLSRATQTFDRDYPSGN